jgi:hypothetical protein
MIDLAGTSGGSGSGAASPISPETGGRSSSTTGSGSGVGVGVGVGLGAGFAADNTDGIGFPRAAARTGGGSADFFAGSTESSRSAI